MIIVLTGAFGFIGSNLVKALNELGYTDIIAVDNLTNGSKIKNLADCQILDFVDKEDFIHEVANGNYNNEVDYIFHQGACSSTTEQDGKYMMKNNYEYSSVLLEFAQTNEIPFVYASSAAVYGDKTKFVEDLEHEYPLNVYAYSKFLFDQIVRRYFETGLKAPVVGLRYFNVYGQREAHKGRMASVVLHNFEQYQATGRVKLFQGCQGYANGGQLRDFISVEDVVKMNLFFFNNHLNDKEEISGIFNCGTGEARSFNALALATVNACCAHQGNAVLSLEDALAQNIIEYIPFPGDLAGRYQCFTQADLTYLRGAGCEHTFLTLEEGVSRYINLLLEKK
ncbi:MAG: ADP-L-glycero-D-manno-heptose 6-epimerase [Pseudomonadota bacterium]|nr:ADP-L-glycero-D-manno-heptose 6-epimerase [Pseudomonadota bacterium]